jgi:hypothetical protein
VDEEHCLVSEATLSLDQRPGERREELVPERRIAKGSKWDVSILEMNLLGGLNQFDRRFAVSKLIPELVRAGLLTRVREHGNVVYRLKDEAKDDARRLIEEGEVSGLIETAFERLSAA